MMRVLIVTTNLAASDDVGSAAAGNTWRSVATELGRHVEGTILAPHASDLPDPDQEDRIGGFHVRRVRPARPVESLEDALRGPGALRVAAVAGGLWHAVRRELRRGDVDLVHAFWAFPAGLVCTMPRLGVPVVVSCPGSDLHGWATHPVAGRIIGSVLRRADAVTAQSTAGLDTARALGAHAVHSLPVCFDPKVFEMSPRRPAGPVVAYAGRMTRAKGVFVLAEALRHLSRAVDDLRFVACGTGPDEEAFEAEVRAALGDRAVFHGPVAPAKVAEVMAGARVCVLGSYGEGMAASVIEALAVGRPVVVTDTGSHVEIVRRGGGSVVPVGDARALAHALRAELTAHHDPAALRRLVAHLTPRFVAERLLEVYEMVSPEKAPDAPSGAPCDAFVGSTVRADVEDRSLALAGVRS